MPRAFRQRTHFPCTSAISEAMRRTAHDVREQTIQIISIRIDGVQKRSLSTCNLMWVYLLLPSLLLNELCISVAIRDFIKSYFWTDVEFLTIQMLLSPSRLVLVLQYLNSPSLIHKIIFLELARIRLSFDKV